MSPLNTILTAFLLAASISIAHAEEANVPPLTADEAKQKWDALTPAQQESFKKQAQNQAEDKKTTWGAMSDDEQAAKKADAKEKAAPQLDTVKSKMQTRRASGGGRMTRH